MDNTFIFLVTKGANGIDLHANVVEVGSCREFIMHTFI